MSRKKGIELRIDTSKISEATLNDLMSRFDIEYYARINEMVLWVHPGGVYKPFTRELFQYMPALKSVHNRRTGGEHLDLFIETVKEAGEFDIVRTDEQESEIVYKTLTPVELAQVAENDYLSEVRLKREL